MNLDAGRTLISVPYSYEANDKPVFEKITGPANNSVK
jgi:hypothetical protein